MGLFDGTSENGPLGAVELVNLAWDKYDARTENWIGLATTAIGDLSSVQIQPINFSVNYNPDTFLPRFVRPTRPQAPVTQPINVQTYTAPDLESVVLEDIGPAPTMPDFSSLVYAPPAPPNQAAPTAPSNVQPVLDPVEIAARPDYVLPEVPTLFDLQLPVVPVITLPEFDGVRPTFDLDMPDDGALAWAEQPYQSLLKDEMTAVLRQMLQGSNGLPVAIEQMIFDRGRVREDRLSRKQVQEVAEDMASRNLTEPNGILASRLREVRADNREKVAGLNRDLTIRTHETALEGLRFAIAQGMALEQVLIQANQSINERALRAATFVREYGINRVNALIAYQNLQQNAYATDAAVWRQRIEGELSKLEVLKSQIDAQRLVGEINKDLVARYVAQFQAVNALAEFYKTDVEAAEAKSRINNQRIEAAKLILQRYDTEVTAWGKLQDSHASQVEAALGTVKFGEVLARAFSAAMDGYRTKGEVAFQRGRFGIERNGQALDRFRAQLAGANQDLQAQLGQLDGVLRVFGAQTALYQADGAIAQAESSALDRSTQMKIESERNRVQILLQQAEININQALKIGEILVEQIKAKASVLSNLVASSQSGVNFGASMSSNQGLSFGYSRGYSYSGDTDDSIPNF